MSRASSSFGALTIAIPPMPTVIPFFRGQVGWFSPHAYISAPRRRDADGGLHPKPHCECGPPKARLLVQNAGAPKSSPDFLIMPDAG